MPQLNAFLAALWLMTAPAGWAQPGWVQPDSARPSLEELDVEALVATLRELDPNERLEAASGALLGARYVLSPLGEGELPDADPRLRFDAFDCTTYLETVAALVLAERFDELLPTLDGLRYLERRPVFEARHHLPVAQWLPAFQARGLLEEVTRELAGEATRTLQLELSPERWRNRSRARSLELEPGDVPEGTFRVDYVPIDRAVELLRNQREPLVLNVVRQALEGSPIVVTHQALLLRSGEGALVVRHASSVHGGVVEMSLARFVAGQALARRWPVVGLNLQRWNLSSGPSADE